MTEARRAYLKKWRWDNREKARAVTKKWSKDNSVRRNEISAAWRKKNPEHMTNLWRKTQLAKYGLTVESFADLLTKQGNRCAIPSCRTATPGGNGNQWAIDHDHETGEVRGLLCFKCNIALGFYEKNKSRHGEFEVYIGRPNLRMVRGGLEG